MLKSSDYSISPLNNKTNNIPYDRHFITCSKCYMRVRRSAFSLVTGDFVCSDCMVESHISKMYQCNNGTYKLCERCSQKHPITSFLTVNSSGCVTLQEFCHLCRECVIEICNINNDPPNLNLRVTSVVSVEVKEPVDENEYDGKIIIENQLYVTCPKFFQSSIGCCNKKDNKDYYIPIENPNYIKSTDMNYEYINISMDGGYNYVKISEHTATELSSYKTSKQMFKSSSSVILNNNPTSSSPSSPLNDSESLSPTFSDYDLTQNTLRGSPYKKSNLRRNTADFRIPYSELHLVVSDEVFRGLHDDRFDELIVYSSNPQEIIDMLPDEKDRKEKLLQEIVAFYKSTRDKVFCKGCKRGVIKADCFIHHTSFLCRECSMKVAPNHLNDWAIYSTVLLKCGRCKHLAPYSKFLKFNGRGEIKRQNTCAFCCLKKWREYYLGVRSY